MLERIQILYKIIEDNLIQNTKYSLNKYYVFLLLRNRYAKYFINDMSL